MLSQLTLARNMHVYHLNRSSRAVHRSTRGLRARYTLRVRTVAESAQLSPVEACGQNHGDLRLWLCFKPQGISSLLLF